MLVWSSTDELQHGLEFKVGYFLESNTARAVRWSYFILIVYKSMRTFRCEKVVLGGVVEIERV